MIPIACAPGLSSHEAGRARPASAAVLVVEDDPILAEIAAEMLAEEGYRVHSAADAVMADAILAGGGIDLLFTDIDLAAGTNGLDLARSARRRAPSLAVVYTSGGRGVIAGQDAVAGSVFVPKPYRLDHVIATLERLLAERLRG